MTSHPARHLPPPSAPLSIDRDRVQVYLFRVATNKSLRKQQSNQSQIEIDCRRGAKSKQQRQQQIGGECNPNRIVGAPCLLLVLLPLLLLFPPLTLCCSRHKVLSAAGRVDFRFRLAAPALSVESTPLCFFHSPSLFHSLSLAM